jgi:hypothetical protein
LTLDGQEEAVYAPILIASARHGNAPEISVDHQVHDFGSEPSSNFIVEQEPCQILAEEVLRELREIPSSLHQVERADALAWLEVPDHGLEYLIRGGNPRNR